MPEQEPNPLTLKSAKYFFHEGRLQIELSDARILRVDGLPRFNLPADLLQPPGFSPSRAVERQVEAAEVQVEAESTPTEGQEKPTVYTFTGRIKGQVREGKLDPQGKKTAWCTFMAHEEGSDRARELLADFRKHTAPIALSLPANAQITASGYIRPSENPQYKDSFYIFQLPNYPGKEKRQRAESDSHTGPPPPSSSIRPVQGRARP